MAETSGLWTTDGAPAGHQVVSYTQALASDMLAIAAACSGFEGVAPGYLNELVPSTTGDNNCRVATGGAMVDGKYYKNSANVDLTIDSASAGHFRIDRVVVRAVWASFTCALTVIKNTVEDAAAPAIVQTSGTTYDIQVAQVRVTDAGVITWVADERKWGIVDTDESTLEDVAGVLQVKDLGITLAKLAADSVDDTKAGNRVPQFYRRQGGSATVWATAGTTTYTPTTVRMQAGCKSCIALASGTTIHAVTFPVAFSYAPLVFLSLSTFNELIAGHILTATGETASEFEISIFNPYAGNITVEVNWLAIGPE